MSKEAKASLYFPSFTIHISSNDWTIFRLVSGHFPAFCFKTRNSRGRRRLLIKIKLITTKYSLLPRSKHDCFHGFTLFHNQFIEDRLLHLDAGPRTLRTVVDFENNTIISLIATPSDLEQDLLFDLIFFQPLKCFLESKGLFLFHSSLVAKNKKGILISGTSGAGKSTVALALARQGYQHLSDDEAVLRYANGTVYSSAFPSFPKLKKKSFKFFPECRKASKGPSLKKDKFLVDVAKIYPCRQKASVVPSVLIFPSHSRLKGIKLQHLDKKKIFKRLLKEEFRYLKPSSNRAKGERFKILAGLLGQVRAYRLYYNDAQIHQIPSMVDTLL